MQILIYVAIFAAKLVEVALATVRNVLINRGEKLYGALIGFVEVMIWIVVVSNVLSSLSQDVFRAVVYCLAFACGNYVGVIIEGKLAIGTALIQVMLSEEMTEKPVPVISEETAEASAKKGETIVMQEIADTSENKDASESAASEAVDLAPSQAVEFTPAQTEPPHELQLKKLLRDRGFGVTTVMGHGLNREVSIMMIYLKRKSVPEALEIIRSLAPAALITVGDVRQMRNGFIRK